MLSEMDVRKLIDSYNKRMENSLGSDSTPCPICNGDILDTRKCKHELHHLSAVGLFYKQRVAKLQAENDMLHARLFLVLQKERAVKYQEESYDNFLKIWKESNPHE